MKKLVSIIVLLFIVGSVSAQFNKLKNRMTNNGIHHYEKNRKKVVEDDTPKPFYSETEKAALISQLRNSKKVDELPVLTTVAYYPSIAVTKIATKYNEITDTKVQYWNKDEKLKVGDTIRVYGIYTIKETADPEHVASIDDVYPVPYRNKLARITPNHDANARFIYGRAVDKCLDYWGDEGIWYIYENRTDTLLLREEYLKLNLKN